MPVISHDTIRSSEFVCSCIQNCPHAHFNSLLLLFYQDITLHKSRWSLASQSTHSHYTSHVHTYLFYSLTWNLLVHPSASLPPITGCKSKILSTTVGTFSFHVASIFSLILSLPGPGTNWLVFLVLESEPMAFLGPSCLPSALVYYWLFGSLAFQPPDHCSSQGICPGWGY